MNAQVETYIKKQTLEVRKRLMTIRQLLKKTLPDADEGLKYGNPAFFNKQVLIVYGAYKHHIGFYPTPLVLELFKSETQQYKTSKGAIQFPHDQPLPLKLIQRMAKARLKESQK